MAVRPRSAVSSSTLRVPGTVRLSSGKDEWRAKLMPRIRDFSRAEMTTGGGSRLQAGRACALLLELDPLSEDAVRGVMEPGVVGDRATPSKSLQPVQNQAHDELGASESRPGANRWTCFARAGAAAPRPAKAGQCRSVNEPVSRQKR